MRVLRRVLPIASLAVICLAISGCFYERLLSFKKQLRDFDDYFVMEEGDAISMICKKPVFLAEDASSLIGAEPTTILGEPPNEVYEYRMIKQYAPDQNEPGNFDTMFRLVMKDNKIERFVMDKRLFASTPKSIWVLGCKMLGHAKVNVLTRSVTMGKIDAAPYLQEAVYKDANEIRQLLGEPIQVAQNTLVYKYRLQQDGDVSSWPLIVNAVTFTDEGVFVHGKSSMLDGLAIERPLRFPTYPVPDNATAVNPQTLARLRWKGGNKAKSHRVYGGADRDHLTLLGEVVDANEIAFSARDHSLPYYWRVEAVEEDGTCHRGDLWSFSAGKLVGRWTFDEQGGQVAHDVSDLRNHGTLLGDATFKPRQGRLGGAISFDGEEDAVDVKDFSLTTHTITMTAWIKGHPADDRAGLIHAYNAPWTGGLFSFPKNRLTYVWNHDSPETWKFKGPTIGKDEWVFLACVVDYDQATLYTSTVSGKLKIRVNKIPHQSQTFRNLKFGRPYSQKTWRLVGLMDDIRIYNYALTRDQIETIRQER